MGPEDAIVVRRREFEAQLGKMSQRFAELLPARVGDPNRFVRQVGVAVLRNPDLLAPDVSRASLIMAVLTLAEMGLAPGPLAHLVAFRQGGKKVVVPIPDYKGLIDVALASGKVSTVDAGCVYKNDQFIFQAGSTPVLCHTPLLTGDRGDFLAAYAMAWPVEGSRPWVKVMSRAEIERIRDGSRGYQFAVANAKDSPWLDGKKPATFAPATPAAAMAMKTAIRALFKLLPHSPEMQRAEQVEDDAHAMRPQPADATVIEVVGEDVPSDAPIDAAERKALLARLTAAQQSEPRRFSIAASGLGIDPKSKLEALSFDGLASLADELEDTES